VARRNACRLEAPRSLASAISPGPGVRRHARDDEQHEHDQGVELHGGEQHRGGERPAIQPGLVDQGRQPALDARAAGGGPGLPAELGNRPDQGGGAAQAHTSRVERALRRHRQAPGQRAVELPQQRRVIHQDRVDGRVAAGPAPGRRGKVRAQPPPGIGGGGLVDPRHHKTASDRLAPQGGGLQAAPRPQAEPPRHARAHRGLHPLARRAGRRTAAGAQPQVPAEALAGGDPRPRSVAAPRPRVGQKALALQPEQRRFQPRHGQPGIVPQQVLEPLHLGAGRDLPLDQHPGAEWRGRCEPVL
jgi:hypothetical protein